MLPVHQIPLAWPTALYRVLDVIILKVITVPNPSLLLTLAKCHKLWNIAIQLHKIRSAEGQWSAIYFCFYPLTIICCPSQRRCGSCSPSTTLLHAYSLTNYNRMLSVFSIFENRNQWYSRNACTTPNGLDKMNHKKYKQVSYSSKESVWNSS